MKLNPKHQFVSSEANVRSILSLYGLSLQHLTPATTGIENTTLIVTTIQGKFVLRVYRQHNKDTEQIEQELRFIDYLRNNGVKVPAIVTTARGKEISIIEIDDTSWQAILMEFVEGSHADVYTPVLLQDMANMQSQMHILSSKFDSTSSSTIHELKEGIFIPLIDMTRLDNPDLVAFIERAKIYDKPLDPHLPAGLCHLDYDRENILADKQGHIAAILDFDDLTTAPFVLDLGYTLWEIWYTNGKDAADTYLALYEQSRPLNDVEKSFLMPIILFRHYVICSAEVVRGENNELSLEKSLKLEKGMRQTEF